MIATASILTSSQIALQAHLEALAEKSRQWVAEDPANRWACSATTDVTHWAEYGIFSVAEYERYETQNLAYELHKDRWGFKPNYAELKAMSMEELDKMIEELSAMPVSSLEDEAADPFIW